MSDTKHETRNPDYKPDNTTVRQKPVIEEVRQWEHAPTPCPRKDKPIYTKPNDVPKPCGRGNPWANGCGSDQWYSKGRKLRDANTKQVVGNA